MLVVTNAEASQMTILVQLFTLRLPPKICNFVLGILVPIPTFPPVYEISDPVSFQISGAYIISPVELNPMIDEFVGGTLGPNIVPNKSNRDVQLLVP